MKRLVVSALTLLLIVPLFGATAATDPIVERQGLMDDTRNALKPMIGMVRGEADFDVVTVMQSLTVMEKVAESAGALFPEGSETGHDTEAKSTIWSDRAGFDQAMADFGTAVNAAIEANPQSADELKPALNGVLKTCKGCHDNYRVEKE